MANAKKYRLAFAGLSLGKHDFEFEVDDAFFDEFENSEIKHGDFKVDVVVNKQTTMLILDFKISGTVKVPCDRCGDDVTLTLEGNNNLIVKLDENPMNDGDDIISVPASEHEIDLSQFIYEYISLLMPSRRVHEEGECDPDVINKLNDISVEAAGEEEKPSDPRWDALKGLTDKKK